MKRVFIGLMAGLISTAAWAESFKVDTAHSVIGFSVKHMMLSNTHGSFTDFEGTVEYDLEKKELKGMEGSIVASSIDTHNEKRDAHLRNEDFFKVSEHPALTFKSTSVKSLGDNRFEVKGLLNILSVDHELTLPVTVNGPIDDPRGNKRIGLECNVTLNRRDLGITHSPAAMIADEVKVQIEAEAIFK